MPAATILTLLPVALKDTRAHLQLFVSFDSVNWPYRSTAARIVYVPAGQPGDVDPLVGELGRIEVAPADRDAVRRAQGAALAAARLEVLAQLRGAGQARIAPVRVEEAEADLRVATRAVGRPQVVREDAPHVPVIVPVARVLHRRGGPDPPGGAAGLVDDLVDDPRLLGGRPAATDLERAPPDVDHHAVEAQEASPARGPLDLEVGHGGDLEVRQLVRGSVGRGGREDPVEDAQDPGGGQ